jgi:hypothetical protein
MLKNRHSLLMTFIIALYHCNTHIPPFFSRSHWITDIFYNNLPNWNKLPKLNKLPKWPT